ncbi:uncharacterized protein I303_108296 [Kwoniella dejecticola CBS 10117]|uniref:DNA replication factor Cdt1 C-terminal domain-containing protein n=1 Tax=Kwoniella dejecticola CBS 10117 TaxID=1296121 RepID=A0A1A5ZXT1_9TREE|nr:uncharacterized protein I303_07377 [Kwoniella dejecticola CBS 10117]OBR82615.1 hypothetical protein I303_07377 [Kwoniella dejecticola CBS 10117]
MSAAATTPKKRKLNNDGLETPRSVRTKSKQGPPTPNPPLVPFPTPPHTQRRKARYVEPVLSKEEQPIAGPSKQSSIELPPHLQTLLNLHHSFNLALSLYIATHPPILPPHPPSATNVLLPNLTNFLAIKETVERTSGRRFGLQELGRLAWIWTWDGKALPNDKAVSERNKQAMIDEDNPFLVPSGPEIGSGEVNGLSYLITPTRTLDPQTGRRVYTHGIGIDLELRKGETRQILHGGAEGGIGNKGQGGGMGAVGRWNTNGEARHDVFRERLEKWVELNGGYEPPVKSILPTPTTSENSTRSSIPPIPVLPLPHLPSSTLLPAANLFSSFSSPSTTLTPQKAHSRPSTDSPKTAGLSDPFELAEKPDEQKAKIVRPGSVDQRRQAMMDRIKARSGTGKGMSTLGSSAGGFPRASTLSAAGQQEELKRRSTLSRLESIAEGVWMMFSAPSPGPSTLPTAPRGRRKAIPMKEVADVIVKSSKTPISTAEAQSSLLLLTELCPFFLNTKQIGKQEWLEMPSGSVNTAPPSPGSSNTIAQPPPSVIGDRGRLAPPSPSTPGRTSNSELAGPASPGRVRRGGGLREVRERIRRELEK